MISEPDQEVEVKSVHLRREVGNCSPTAIWRNLTPLIFLMARKEDHQRMASAVLYILFADGLPAKSQKRTFAELWIAM